MPQAFAVFLQVGVDVLVVTDASSAFFGAFWLAAPQAAIVSPLETNTTGTNVTII